MNNMNTYNSDPGLVILIQLPCFMFPRVLDTVASGIGVFNFDGEDEGHLG